MGNRSSHGFEELPDAEDAHILMLGLDCAGKTTMLHWMRHGEVMSTIPTIGFNVETVQFRNMNFNVLDTCSQSSKSRPLLRPYFEQSQGLIFVVDSTDRSRLEKAKVLLAQILAEKFMRSTALLILANKQDLPGAITKDEVAEKLGLHHLQCTRWVVKPVCAVDGSGLSDALHWLSTEVAAATGPRIGRGGKGFGKQSFL
jgi:small GTP-binding protein